VEVCPPGGWGSNIAMNLYALIVAGGSGKRMGTEIPKQFLELSGKPVLIRTIEKFWLFDASIKIITVLPEDQLGYWEKLQKKHSFSIPCIVVKGGPARFFSVKNGLEKIEDNSLVAIHDGVRPLVSIDTIKRCFEAAQKFGNAVPVISPADSVRMITEKGNIPVNRQFLRIIQTPQVFDSKLIKKAYLQDYNPEFTDDASLLEKTGEAIHLVEGNRENLKITNPGDLAVAEALYNTIF
jgi:2-C-methyl-D-erythritol 4-phosphate cytidylyltransferase